MIFDAELGDGELQLALQSLEVEHIQKKAEEGELHAFRLLQKLSAYYDNEQAREAIRVLNLDHWIHTRAKDAERTDLLMDAAFWGNEVAQWALIFERGSDPVIDKFFYLLPIAKEPAARQIREKLNLLEHPPEAETNLYDETSLESVGPANWDVWRFLKFLSEMGNAKAAAILERHLQNVAREKNDN